MMDVCGKTGRGGMCPDPFWRGQKLVNTASSKMFDLHLGNRILCPGSPDRQSNALHGIT